jgi:hypothetical protein
MFFGENASRDTLGARCGPASASAHLGYVVALTAPFAVYCDEPAASGDYEVVDVASLQLDAVDPAPYVILAFGAPKFAARVVLAPRSAKLDNGLALVSEER